MTACGPEKAGTDSADDSDTSSGDTSTTGGSTGSTDPTTSGTTDGSTSDPSTGDPSTGGPVGQECACIVDEQAEPDTPSQPTCGATLCDTVMAEGGIDSLVVGNLEALECVLTALRDRTPGIVRWSSTENGGQYTDDGYALINQDGTAVRRNWGAYDITYMVSDATFGTLPDPSVFEQCLAGGTDHERFHCATHFDLGAPTLVCDEGWAQGMPF